MDSRALILLASELMGVIAVMLLAGLSKSIRLRRPLGFKYPRREAVVSLTLFSLIMFGAILFYTGVIPTPQPLFDIPEELWQQLLAALVALAVTLLALFIRKQPIRSAGWSNALLSPSFRLGLALVFLTVFLRGAIFQLINGISRVEITGLIIWLIIAFAEETVFRGFLQLRVTSFFGEKFGWLVTALVFIIWQIPRLILHPETIWIRLAIVAVQAVLLCWLMKRSGHVLGIALYRASSEWIWLLA
jgi:membrane protease YdiL (CAAX protease family)